MPREPSYALAKVITVLIGIFLLVYLVVYFVRIE
jgi:hypothetical protein